MHQNLAKLKALHFMSFRYERPLHTVTSNSEKLHLHGERLVKLFSKRNGYRALAEIISGLVIGYIPDESGNINYPLLLLGGLIFLDGMLDPLIRESDTINEGGSQD